MQNHIITLKALLVISACMGLATQSFANIPGPYDGPYYGPHGYYDEDYNDAAALIAPVIVGAGLLTAAALSVRNGETAQEQRERKDREQRAREEASDV